MGLERGVGGGGKEGQWGWGAGETKRDCRALGGGGDPTLKGGTHVQSTWVGSCNGPFPSVPSASGAFKYLTSLHIRALAYCATTHTPCYFWSAPTTLELQDLCTAMAIPQSESSSPVIWLISLPPSDLCSNVPFQGGMPGYCR